MDNLDERVMKLELTVDQLEKSWAELKIKFEKMDGRLRSVERSIWIACGVVAALELFLKFQ